MTTYAAPAYDLRSLIESRAPTRLICKSRISEQYAGQCPFCGGRDRFLVWPYREHPGYFCRGCRRTGGPVRFLMDYENKTKWEALQELDLQDENEQHSLPPTSMTHLTSPAKKWRERARGLCHVATQALHGEHGGPGMRY